MSFFRSARCGFTLLEVALVVAIIGMIIMILIGWLIAPEKKGPLPPVPEFKPILSTPAPASPPPGTPASAATPSATIELNPQGAAPFR